MVAAEEGSIRRVMVAEAVVALREVVVAEEDSVDGEHEVPRGFVEGSDASSVGCRAL